MAPVALQLALCIKCTPIHFRKRWALDKSVDTFDVPIDFQLQVSIVEFCWDVSHDQLLVQGCWTIASN
jgi:hypothetical protein